MNTKQKEFFNSTLVEVREIIANPNYSHRVYLNTKGETVFEYTRVDGPGSGVIVCDFVELAQEVNKMCTPIVEKDAYCKLIDKLLVTLPEGNRTTWASGILEFPDGIERKLCVYTHNGKLGIMYSSIRDGKGHGRTFEGRIGGKVRKCIQLLM